ncbi:iron complex transport system permease protein [Enterococcus malodoratus]|uniref:FecCD family ABC transporter permease n=1 Tax=Enterococcus malodoratus TaxID=71451 RepID=UPI0008ABCCBF|nr:iron ABC transporter permease [Enterococcus malodoratus]SES66040.1 iron complex transport system permease protein [Enterococcus malodoratus]
MTKRKYFFPVVFILLIAAMFLSLRYGAVTSKWTDVSQALLNFDPNNQGEQLVRYLRLPRMIGAVLVGAGFAISGALIQGITSNPIADSGLLGINSGAGLGLALVFAFSSNPSPTAGVIGSFLGASVSILLIYLVSSRVSFGLSPVRIVLLGAALSSFFAAISQSISLLFDLNQDMTFWFVGGTANLSWNQLQTIFPLILIGVLGACLISPQVTLLSMGDETAISLGKKPNRIRQLSMLFVLLLAGSSVALVGTISFIGLIVPHVVRFFIGHDYRYVIPASGLFGALFFVLADIASRLIAPPLETPTGVIVTIIGVPFLLLQIRKGSL